MAVSDAGVATITMARPPVNSLNLGLLKELHGAIGEMEREGARGIVLTSALATVFSSGLDIKEMYKPDTRKLEEFWSTFQDCWASLYGCKLPTAAAITGHSPAGGCVLCLSCDYRVIQGPAYVIGLNETQLGLTAPYWVKDMAVQTMGSRQAELALELSTLFPADKAKEVGLVDEVTNTREECLEAAHSMVERLARIPREARHVTKMMMREPFLENLLSRKEEDIRFTVDAIKDPSVQAVMAKYIEAMKSKKK